MDFSEHLALSLPVSAGIYMATGDPYAATAWTATGVFIDLDHVPDYWRETGINFDHGRFMSYFPNGEAKHLLLLLHAWEWPTALLAAGLAGGAPLWVLAAALGWLAHLVQDELYNGLKPYSYFFFYRWRTGFSVSAIYYDKAP